MTHRSMIVLVTAILFCACTSTGTSRYASYCGSKAACEGGGSDAVDSCISIFEQDAADSDEDGCGAEFDAAFVCRELDSFCDSFGGVSAYSIRGCAAESDAYLMCRF